MLVYPGERIFVPSGVKTRVDLEPIPMVTQIPQSISQSPQRKGVLPPKSDGSYKIISFWIVIFTIAVFILFLSDYMQKKISKRKATAEKNITEEKKEFDSTKTDNSRLHFFSWS